MKFCSTEFELNISINLWYILSLKQTHTHTSTYTHTHIFYPTSAHWKGLATMSAQEQWASLGLDCALEILLSSKRN